MGYIFAIAKARVVGEFCAILRHPFVNSFLLYQPNNVFPVYFFLFITFGFAEVRLHLGNIQINLVFRSICTNFAS